MRYFTNVHDFYNCKEWKTLKQILMQERTNENGELICEYCGKPMLHTYDCIPHHYKIPLTLENVNDPNVSLNKDNLMLVHFKCHNELEKRFCSFERKVFLVVGAPCSGKSSFVKNNATKDDLILDFDNIWEAISVNKRYDKSKRIKPIAFALRECLLEQIKMRSGSWVNCYVISTEPYVMNRKMLSDRIRADETIFMDTKREECIKRLMDEPQGRNIEEYTGFINNYYDNFQSDDLA